MKSWMRCQFLDALLLLHRKVAGAQVDQEEETADDGCWFVKRVSDSCLGFGMR